MCNSYSSLRQKLHATKQKIKGHEIALHFYINFYFQCCEFWELTICFSFLAVKMSTMVHYHYSTIYIIMVFFL